MTLLAKSIIKNKCWVIEDSGTQIASILASPTGVILVQDGNREKFASLKLLSDKHNIIFDKTKKQVIKETGTIYGYSTGGSAYHVLWDVKKKIPVFTKLPKSKSFYCAGYYIIQLNDGWTTCHCPKLITINRYPYLGPYKTQAEMQTQFNNMPKELYGTSEFNNQII